MDMQIGCTCTHQRILPASIRSVFNENLFAPQKACDWIPCSREGKANRRENRNVSVSPPDHGQLWQFACSRSGGEAPQASYLIFDGLNTRSEAALRDTCATRSGGSETNLTPSGDDDHVGASRLHACDARGYGGHGQRHVSHTQETSKDISDPVIPTSVQIDILESSEEI